MSQFEQRENVKFCQKFGKSASEMFQMIKQEHGEEVLGCCAVFKWHKRFAQGRDSLEDDEHTGRLRTVRTEFKSQKVRSKILSDDRKMSRVTKHSVPRLLKQHQRDDRTSICGNVNFSADKDGTFLNRIITGDET
jgi:hypothetical protein